MISINNSTQNFSLANFAPVIFMIKAMNLQVVFAFKSLKTQITRFFTSWITVEVFKMMI